MSKIQAGDKVKISKNLKAVVWDVIGVRPPFKDMPNRVFLILQRGKTVRRNVDIFKVCVLYKQAKVEEIELKIRVS